jgi:hypothetical protein
MAHHNAVLFLQFLQQHSDLIALSIHFILTPTIGLWRHNREFHPSYDDRHVQYEAHGYPNHEETKHVPSPNIPPSLIFNHRPMCAAAPYTASAPRTTPVFGTKTKVNSLQSSMIVMFVAIVVVFLLIAGYTWWEPSQKLHTPHNPISSPHSELQDAQIDNSDARTQLKDTQIALKKSEFNVIMLKDEVKTLRAELADLQSELATANGAVEDLFTLVDQFVKDQRQLQY